MEKLIINFTPTGMIVSKEMNHTVPIDPDEIIEQVHAANEMGITIAHLHAREEGSGAPTWRKEIYQKIMDGVRKHCPDLIICFSLSGRNVSDFEKRSAPIEIEPDMGSLTLSSLNFRGQASVNGPETVTGLSKKMKDYGVKPELEVFDLGMINYAKYLIKKEILTPPYYFNLLFNNIAGMQPDMAQIGLSIKELPDQSFWALAGLGAAQLQVNALAIASGGGVRVGLEDNIYYDRKRKRLATNLDLLKRIHALAEIHERPLMTASEFGRKGFYNARKLSST